MNLADLILPSDDHRERSFIGRIFASIRDFFASIWDWFLEKLSRRYTPGQPINQKPSLCARITSSLQDEFIEKLSYRYTTFLLFCLALWMCAEQYVGTTVECFAGHIKQEATKSMIEYVKVFCLVQSNYDLIPDDQLTAGRARLEEHKVYDDEPYAYEYHLMHFYLAITAAMIYFPFMLKRTVLEVYSGDTLKELIGLTSDTQLMNSDERAKTLRMLADKFMLEIKGARQKHDDKCTTHVKEGVGKLRHCGYFQTLVFLATKILFIVSNALQLVISKKVFGFKSMSYGLDMSSEVLSSLVQQQDDRNFTTSYNCTYEVLDGDRVRSATALCQYETNMFVEKLMMFLFCWNVLVGFITVLNCIYWVIWLALPCIGKRMIRGYLKNDKRATEIQICKFIDRYIKKDGIFLIQRLTIHAGRKGTRQLVNVLFNDFYTRKEAKEVPLMSEFTTISEGPESSCGLHFRKDSDFVDRLNYFYSSCVLIFVSILVFMKQYTDPIHCYIPFGFTSFTEDNVEEHCWQQTTTALRAWDASDAPLWLPIILIMYAIMFYFPSLLWRILQFAHPDYRVSRIVQLAREARFMESRNRIDAIETIISQLKPNKTSNERHKCTSCCCARCGCYMTISYLFSKMLLLGLSVYILVIPPTHYLAATGNMKHFYAETSMRVTETEEEESGINWRFPYATLCDFQPTRGEKRGYFGTATSEMLDRTVHEVQCMLTINAFHDSLVMFLFSWMFVLLIANTLDFLYWIVIMFIPGLCTSHVTKYLEKADQGFEEEDVKEGEEADPEDESAARTPEAVKRFVKRYLSKDDLFVLRMIIAHGADRIANQIVLKMWDDFVESGKRRIEKLPNIKDKERDTLVI